MNEALSLNAGAIDRHKQDNQMARIFITGSSDGLGQMAAKLLVAQGRQVVLHARNKARAEYALAQVPGARSVPDADLSSIEETKALAYRINDMGHFDAVIHNAAEGFQEPGRIATVDGLPHVLAVNSLAPYILTALINVPKRLIYISLSGRHAPGTECKPVLTLSYMLCCSLLQLPVVGPKSYLTAPNPAGLQRRWAEQMPLTISILPVVLRPGSRPVPLPRVA